MSITLVGQVKNSASTGTAVSVTHGLTIQENDVVIALINLNGAASRTLVDNNGSNAFTNDITEGGTSPTRVYQVWSRVAGASEPASYNFTASTSDRWSIILIVRRGVDTSSIYDVAPSNTTLSFGSGSPWSADSITTATDGALAIAWFMPDGDSGTASSPTNGYGDLVTIDQDMTSSCQSKVIATAGATGSTAATTTYVGTWYSIQFALKAAPPPNQPPSADDDSFTIFTNAQVGDVLGTVPVSDSDGTVDSASITGTNFDIDTAGEITVISTSGLTAGVITEDVTFTDNDGDSTVVTITINVTEPQLRVDSVSTTTPAANSNFTVDITNAEAAVSAFITMGGTDYPLIKVSDNGSQAVFTAPDIADFGNQTANYNSPLTVNLTDGTTIVSLPNPIRVQAEAGYEFGAVTTPSPVGNYKNAVGVATGNSVYQQILTGNPQGDIGTGVYTVTQASTMRFRIYDGLWGDWTPVTFEAPVQQTNQAPTANAQTFSISENAANGTQIGQLTASDSDGSIVNFSLPAGPLATTSGGLLTLADNSGLVAGTPITATVTFADNDGATGTATITVNVTAVQAVVNVGLSFEIRDAENSNALITNETGLDFVIYDGFGGTELLEVSAVSSSALGVVVIDNNALGDVGDDVFIVAVRSNGQTVCGTETVIDLDA